MARLDSGSGDGSDGSSGDGGSTRRDRQQEQRREDDRFEFGLQPGDGDDAPSSDSSGRTGGGGGGGPSGASERAGSGGGITSGSGETATGSGDARRSGGSDTGAGARRDGAGDDGSRGGRQTFGDEPTERVDLQAPEDSAERRRQRRQEELREHVADETDIDETEILQTERTDEGIAFELTPRAQATRATEFESGDIRRLERTQGGGLIPVLTDEAREERATRQALRQFRSDQRPRGTGLDPGRAQGSLGREVTAGDVDVTLSGDQGASVQLEEDFLREIQARDRTETRRPREGLVPGFGSDTPGEVALEGDGDVTSERSGEGFSGRVAGSVEGLFEESRETVSPFARLSLDDPDALEARREKEREMFESAEGAFDFSGDFSDPSSPLSGEEALATLGVFGDVAGRSISGFGTRVREATTSAGGQGPFTPTTLEADPSLNAAIGEATGGQVNGLSLGESIEDVPGNFLGGSIEFAGMGVSAVGQAPFSVSQDLQSLAAGEETPTGIQGGAGATVEQFGESQVEAFQEFPISTTAGFALPAAAGVPAGVRGFRSTSGTRGRTVQLGEITSERGVSGELPRFETQPGEATSRAVGEVQRRAADQPEVVQEAAGSEQVLFHTTENPLGRNLVVGEGASELPGLFTSPDASPLRLPTETQQGGRLFGLGDFSTTPEQVAAFESPRIAGMPDTASGAAHAVRRGGEIQETGLSRAEANRIVSEQGGQRVPDPTTSGFRFLTEEADPGTAFVRGRGSRTSELEAIFPPESRFGATERIGVEMPGGETVPMDIFRLGDQPARRGGGQAAPESVSAAEIGSQFTTLGEVRGQPTFTPTPTFGSLGGAGGGLFGPSIPGVSGRGSSSTGTGGPFDAQGGVTGATTSFEPGATTPFATRPTSTAPGAGGRSGSRPTPTRESTGIFTGRPTGTGSDPSRAPPTSRPPTDPTGIFTSPSTRGPPSRPPGAPPGSSPPSRPGNPFFPGDPSGQPRGAFDFGARDSDEDERAELLPAGTTFENPIATGSTFLFGDLFSGGDRQQDEDRQQTAQQESGGEELFVTLQEGMEGSGVFGGFDGGIDRSEVDSQFDGFGDINDVFFGSGGDSSFAETGGIFGDVDGVNPFGF